MIKLSLEEKMKFIESYINNEIDLNIINERPNEPFRKTILEEFECLLELSDLRNLKSWFKAIQIPNTKVEDFRERIIETSNGKILIGIRFLGMDRAKPFISIWANHSLEKSLEEIKNKAIEEFSIFQPKYLRFWTKPDSILFSKYQDYITQQYLINSIYKIQQLDFPINYHNIELKLIASKEYYSFYKNIYNDFHESNPELKAYISTNSVEEMDDSLNEKLLYYIFSNNEKIGIISAVNQAFLGKKSLYMMDIAITTEFKGKKLASAAMRKLIDIQSNDYKYIWGTIDIKNLPSTKNALRIGRNIISSEILLPI